MCSIEPCFGMFCIPLMCHFLITNTAWKRGQTPYNGGSYNKNNSSNNGFYSSHFNPPSNRNNYTPLHNSSSSTYRSSSCNVSNPYKSKPANPYQNSSTGNLSSHTGRTSHQYASEMLRNTGDNASSGKQTQSYGSLSQKTQPNGSTTHQIQSYQSSGQQHQNRTWSSARNQRQFGTAIDISVDYSTSSTSPKFSSSKSSHRVSLNTPLSSAGNDNSSVSSASSGDDIISFDIFGKAK